VGRSRLGRVSLDGDEVESQRQQTQGNELRPDEKKKQQQLKERSEAVGWSRAAAADEQEDRQYGSKRGDELPEELRRRETRLAKIKQAKKVVRATGAG